MVKDHGIIDRAYEYFDQKAPVLFFILSAEGYIVDANRYAETITGRNLNGENIQNLFVDFTGKFNLVSLLQNSSEEHLLHFITYSGMPQSFYFSFQLTDDHVLAFGRSDTKENENMRKEVLSLNQELNNLMRQLHQQNAQLQRLNKELRNSADRFDQLAEQSRTITWEVDAKGLYTFISHASGAVLGYLPEEIVGKMHFYDLHPESGREAFRTAAFAVFDRKEAFQNFENAVQTKDGRLIWVSTNGIPLLASDGTLYGYRGSDKDITERKQAEAEKAELEVQNRQLQKTESLGRMAGAIAHHFNNQLFAVMGNLEMAMDELPCGADISETLSEAQKAARKAAEVSRLMLTYLGQTPGKHEPIDLSEAYRQSLTLLLVAAPKGLILNADFPSCGPIINADAGQMQQLLTNIVTNAWESIADNRGTIGLSVKMVSHEDIPTSKRFPIDWQLQEIDYACLEVSDTGSGISNKDIEKLFDPFFTTKFTGRGLGLPVVMGIVKAHGGGVTVESEPGHGSIFRIFLPVSTEKLPLRHDLPAMPEAQQTVAAEKLSKIEGGGTVLLIEDEEPVRNMAKKMLTRLGYKILEAKDGAEAVDIFQKHQDEILCVLSDLTMPRMDGWETLAALRKLSPGIPVILSSGYDEAKVMAEEHTEIQNAFLAKPYQIKGLRETINRVLTDPAEDNGQLNKTN